MRSILALLVAASPLLASCHKADGRAVTQMAQCAGAMGIEHEYLAHLSPPRYDLLPPLSAGIAWYKYKLRVAGVPDQGRAESIAFIDRHLHDPNLGKMVTACGHQLWADPEYRANFTDLVRYGIANDWACKPDPTRCKMKPS